MLATSGLIWLISLLIFLVGMVLFFLPAHRATGKKAIFASVGIWVLSMGMCIVAPKDRDAGARSTAESPETAASRTPSSEPARPSSPIIDATTLVDSYQNNELAADNTYKGRRFRIQGTIDTIGKDILDNPYVTLKNDDGFRSVQCFLARGSVSRAGHLSKGDSVTVEGRVDGLMMNVLVKNCDLQ